MGLRWINIFVFNLFTFSYIEFTLSPYNDFHRLVCKHVSGEIWEIFYLWTFSFFFYFALKPENQNCLYDKFKNSGREINTDLQLLLHSSRQTWWRHKPCSCQLCSEHCPALGMCSLSFQDVQRLSTHKFITNILHRNYTPSDIQNRILVSAA